jgi:acetolactate synthase II small subunit
MNDLHALGLVLSRSEGALLRLLGTVQRRGFEIAGLSTQARDADTWIVLMQLSSARDVQVLKRHVEKLYDVVGFLDTDTAPRRLAQLAAAA